MSHPQPREHLPALEPYQLAERDASGRRLIHLDQNENASAPSAAALEALRKTLGGLMRYPDGDAGTLREAIAEAEGLPAAQIICGAGSMELLGLIGQAYLRPGDEAVMSRYGYLFFRSVTAANGADVVLAADKGFNSEADALLARVTPRTRVLFLANPNNPTGSLIGRAELQRLRAGLREDVLLVLDGAYAEYVTIEDYDPGAALVAAGSNTVMLRSFSKIHGLAGLRTGWGYFPSEIAAILNRIRHPNGVTAPSIAAAAAAIRDRGHIAAVRSANAARRGLVVERLAALGLVPWPSHCNFMLLPFDSAATAARVFQYLKQEGIMLRPMAGYGLAHCLRITIGTREEMESLLQALTVWRSQE